MKPFQVLSPINRGLVHPFPIEKLLFHCRRVETVHPNKGFQATVLLFSQRVGKNSRSRFRNRLPARAHRGGAVAVFLLHIPEHAHPV